MRLAPTRAPATLRVIATFIVTTAAIALVTRVGLPSDLAAAIVASVFFGAALWLSRRDPRGPAHYGISLGGLVDDPPELGRGIGARVRTLVVETSVAVGVAALVFPPFALAFAAFHRPDHAFGLRFADDFPSFALSQLVVVAVPEEAFFRGYVQTRLEDAYPRRTKVLGVTMSLPALLLQALFFALIHVAVDLRPTSLSVFFPGVLFGVLRTWRGGIGAAVVFHALCNLYADVLFESWLR